MFPWPQFYLNCRRGLRFSDDKLYFRSSQRRCAALSIFCKKRRGIMELPRRCPTSNVLCLVICVLLAWIAVSHMSRSHPFRPQVPGQRIDSRPDQSYAQLWRTEAEGIVENDGPREPGYAARWRTEAEGMVENDECHTRDGHYQAEPATGNKSTENAWRQMKWIGQPAACRVRGELIERLDALNNFRRGFALGFSSNVEDRIHILPWLLGTKVDLNRSKRRVFLDLGSNSFSSSIQWFLQMYPCDFTEIHAFEIQSQLLEIPRPFDEESNRRAGNPSSRRTKQRAGIPAWMIKRIKVYNKLVSDVDDLESKSINITRFIKQELRLSPEDTVIVKMDIEECEWPILTSWLNDLQMVQIVDEIFVEVHYNHPSMYDYNWNKFKHNRDQAKRLLADLRWKGFYIHFWP